MKFAVIVMLGLSIAGIAICERAWGGLFPEVANQDVVLSDKQVLLGPEATRVVSEAPLKVVGFRTHLCVVLADDVANDADIQATYKTLRGGARLTAVLHSSGRGDVVWNRGNWAFVPGKSGQGSLSACLRWEHHEAPPRGTEITSIDLSADRPLKIHGVHWSSTAAFDFLSEPPPDLFALSSAEYRELEAEFGGKAAWPSQAHTPLRVQLTSSRRGGSSSEFNSTIGIRMAEDGIQLQPAPNAVGMGIVTIPTEAVEACSMKCFSSVARHAVLLLPEHGMQVEFLNTPEVIDWCWLHRIPMASSDARGAWLYEGEPLPGKTSYADQLSSRQAYDDQAERSCMGR